MSKLEKELMGFIKYVKDRYKVDVITSIIDADEGEIKIKSHVLRNQKRYPQETHLICSADSDMILLLFTCNDLTKIYQMIDKKVIVHFGTLLDSHRKKFGSTNTEKYDFVFINLMMGNDYFPKVAYLKLENVWDAYKIISRTRPTGLVSCQNCHVKVDQVFIHDLLYYATKKTRQYMMDRFNFADIADKTYKDYVQGLYWCFGMYVTGNCSDYRYICEDRTSLHVTGVLWSIFFNNTYTISKSDSIDVDLCGILLIPEKAKILLSKEQNLIATQLVEKHPVIYEEGRCKKCGSYSTIIKNLHKKQKLIDSDSDEAFELKKQINKINRGFKAHKEHHETITAEKIEQIARDFSVIRDKLRDTIDLESSGHEDDDLVVKPYHPKSNTKIIKKRMF
jgi:hypothetical protein